MREYKVKTVTSLARGLQVLKVLQQVRAASLHDLHRATGIPKATLTRILLTCHEEGLVWQRIADGAFLPSHSLRGRVPPDDAQWLVEAASPILEQLCNEVTWPSILSVPRLYYMETIETNSPHAYFDAVPFVPIGFRSNMLRAASGRAYLAFCPPAERRAIVRRLREREGPGHELAHRPQELREILAATVVRGYGVRASDFGGDYSRPRNEADDRRDSIAVPIHVDDQVVGCMNLTWLRDVTSREVVVDCHLPALQAAVGRVEVRAAEVAEQMTAVPSGAG